MVINGAINLQQLQINLHVLYIHINLCDQK